MPARLASGAEVRLIRIEVRPSAAADVIEVFGDLAVAELAEAPGFCSALLFADQRSGHLISKTTWLDAQARAASPRAAALIRSDLLAVADRVITGADLLPGG